MDNKSFESNESTETEDAKVPSYLAVGSDVKVDVEHGVTTRKRVITPATKPYAGMGKEDLLRFSQTPFWNRLRTFCVVLFWGGWLGLIAAVVALTLTSPRCTTPPTTDWWQKGVLYQIYVRSFYDSNGDGIGDLKGIESKLDYLAELKTDAILLSSFYQGQSGQHDLGYEVTDHKAVDPVYGTMDDLESLLSEAHIRDIRVVIDFIPNYTGDQHEWFNASRASGNRSNEYWNYYTWADCQEGEMVNNWLSVYGNSSWQRDDVRGECYLHQFLPSQPELNLRSSRVRQELEDILKFWLDKGVDGFRVNQPAYLYEDMDLRDEPRVEDCTAQNVYDCQQHVYTRNQAENYNLIMEWRSLLEKYISSKYRVLLTDSHEVTNVTADFFGVHGGQGAHIPINYDLNQEDHNCDAMCIADYVNAWMAVVPSGNTVNWAVASQDLPRPASREGAVHAALTTMLTLSLPGVPLVYYGDEIGMTNGDMTGRTSIDPAGWTDTSLSRDAYRAPMQWTDEQYGGFMNLSALEDNGGSAEPWLPVNADYTEVNVYNESRTSNVTMLSIFHAMSELRRLEPAIHLGHFHEALVSKNIYSYVREYEGFNSFLLALNFGQEEEKAHLASSLDLLPKTAEVYYSNSDRPDLAFGNDVTLDDVTLSPGEGVVFSWPYSR